MNIVLVNMPWQALDYPSLACGILVTVLRQARPQHNVLEYYGNLRWAEYLLQVTEGQITPTEYTFISDNTFYYGAGDWIFSTALYTKTQEELTSYKTYLEDIGVSQENIHLISRMQSFAPAFIEKAVDEIMGMHPDVVGFSTTFMQNCASLAAAKRIKEKDPKTVIVFGGGNCDGEQGIVMHRNFSFIDFVVRGEGEESFIRLLDTIETGQGEYEDIPGLCWRKDGVSETNQQQKTPMPIWKVPEPTYDAYFHLVQSSEIRGYIEPKLVFEGSRGCWWGEKNQCTFCGLNGSTIMFRSKDPEKLWESIQFGVKKYQTLDVIMVDNIMDMKYFDKFLPRIKSVDWDLRFHYEVKSNLTEQHVRSLREAHIFHIQPGIESLSTKVLKIMKKGVTGIHNIKLLRWCEENNLDVSWNYLCGFPGETKLDYVSIIEQLPALYHLHPPASATRIALERFSPYFENSSLGLRNNGPARFYRYIYDLPSSELFDIAYLFESSHEGIGEDVVEMLKTSISRWIEQYPISTLQYYHLENGTLLIEDRRSEEPRDIEIKDPILVRSYIELLDGIPISTLSERLTRSFGYTRQTSEKYLAGWLNDLMKEKLVFAEGDRYVAVATKPNAQRIRIAG
ncbi:RiPP maturation radical SAM C-methyltransferase [Alicyclobacillus shizuokensis]|uniref:RiPP maturation radical SAM C-methyltransferase n=1 Tax=Alicyclobacillus shizuokensis TaxID=392014 RepID=UPI0008376AD0|nr:RiPP maturation radical SAM C-methyltransferase [Alicyclobacillus shizuokensis]